MDNLTVSYITWSDSNNCQSSNLTFVLCFKHVTVSA